MVHRAAFHTLFLSKSYTEFTSPLNDFGTICLSFLLSKQGLVPSLIIKDIASSISECCVWCDYELSGYRYKCIFHTQVAILKKGSY